MVAWFRAAAAKRSDSHAAMEKYESPLILSLNGQDLARLSGMYIPDQFWKHYAVEILTCDAELKRKMLEDENFWLHEKFILTREIDGVLFKLNTDDSLGLIGINQARRLREDSEISLRGI